MKKLVLSIVFILVCSFVFAQSIPPVYSEVYTIADCLNAYEGTTCIITGTISSIDNTYHNDRYIIKDGTGKIYGRFSHHITVNNADIISGSYKITGEIRGINHHPDIHNNKTWKHNDNPYLYIRYIEK